jgi:hypothetical protein
MGTEECILCHGAQVQWLLPILAASSVIVVSAAIYISNRIDATKFVKILRILLRYSVLFSLIVPLGLHHMHSF